MLDDKRCSTCFETKPVSAFFRKQYEHRIYYKARCKECSAKAVERCRKGFRGPLAGALSLLPVNYQGLPVLAPKPKSEHEEQLYAD